MKNELQIKDIEIVNDLLLVNWSDDRDSMIPLETLRKKCPCAGCVGEKDVLGNLYKGPEQTLTENSFRLNGIQPVGYYGIRPFWADGHSTGIYTMELLTELAAEL